MNNFRLLVTLATTMLVAGQSATAAIGTSFTYQGRIEDGSSWASGQYDFQFRLYDAASNGTQLGSANTVGSVQVTEGFFTVSVDFGSVFTGDARWLQTEVKPVGASSYTTLTPRQELKPVPYAMFATNGGAGGSSGGWTDNGTSVYVTEASRKVGIGTTTPACRLAVEADLPGDPRSLLRIKNLASTNDSYLDLYVGVPGWFDDYLLFLRNGNIVFGVTSDNWFWLNRNVAIADNTCFQSTANGNHSLCLRDGSGNFVIGSGGATLFHMSGAEKLRITQGGNVGIGTTSPGAKLDIAGGGLFLKASGATTGTQFMEWSNSAGDIALGINGSEIGGTYPGTAAYSTVIGNGVAYPMHLVTQAAIRATILANGNFGIGTTSPSEKLHVVGTARLEGIGSSTGTTVVADSNGKLWKSSSSRRYKTDIHNLAGDGSAVLDLQPVAFQWKTTGQADVGVIAEDVEKILPDLVIYDNEGRPDAVKYDKIALYLLRVVKQQQGTMASQARRIAELEREREQNQTVLQRLAALEKAAGLVH